MISKFQVFVQSAKPASLRVSGRYCRHIGMSTAFLPNLELQHVRHVRRRVEEES
jgi:hypothetical protein